VWYKHCGDLKLLGTKGGFFEKDEYKYADLALPVIDFDDDDKGDGWVFYAVASATQRGDGTDKCYPIAAKDTALVWADGGKDQSADNDDKLTVPDDVMNCINVYNASKAKLCASFTSNFNGMGEWLTFGDYAIYIESTDGDVDETEATADPATITVIPACAVDADEVAEPIPDDRSDSDMDKSLAKAPTQQAIFTVNQDSGKVTDVTAATLGSCDTNFASKVQTYFSLGLDTCVNAKNIRNNFGWKDVVESCFTWSGNATAIVDVQCEVEIPKTGDVSVIAYAVMAVVAAAGAMGLKK